MPGSDKVAGFYMGPDGYIWGREHLSTEPDSPRQLVIAKRWYSFMLWGRLTYDPSLPDALFLKTIANRFPEVPAEQLSSAWSAASMVFPEITRFFWGDIDLRWFPEACLDHPKAAKGFYTVAHFMDGETMPGSGTLDIVEMAAPPVGRPADGRRDLLPDPPTRWRKTRRTPCACSRRSARRAQSQQGTAPDSSATWKPWRTWATTTRRRSAVPPISPSSTRARSPRIRTPRSHI